MRNLYILWDEPLNSTGGGIHRCISNLLSYMPQRGYNVFYIYSKDFYRTFRLTSKDSEVTLSLRDLRKYLIENHCDIILGQEAIFSSSLTKAVKELNIPKVVFINQYHNTLSFFDKKFNWNYLRFQWIFNRSVKMRLGIMIRAILFPLWKYNVNRQQNAIYRYNYENSDISLLLSEYELLRMKKITNDVQLKKCRVIHNPLSWEKIESPNILSSKKKEVLIVSRIFNPEKRIDLALKCWKIIEQNKSTEGWTLRILGEGIHKDYLMELTAKLGLKNVVWEGRKDPIPYYREASIFLLTSAMEGWGLTLTESMQTGVVPIAFDSYPAVKNIITDGENGYLVPFANVKLMAQRLEFLMNNNEIRNNMAIKGLKDSQRFAISPIMDEWKKLLDSV